MTGKFIVLEGIDGSGITTQVEMLRVWFETQRVPIFVTKEPSDGPVGGLLRAALTHRMRFSADVMAMLFAADRVDHLEYDIGPKLEAETNVISDRYYLSSFAYQSQDVDLNWLRQLNSRCRKPDVTIFLDVPIEVCLERWQSDVWRSHDRLQLYENEELLRKVRESYLKIGERLNQEGEVVHTVDGTQPMEAVASQIAQLVQAALVRHSHGGKITPLAERSQGSREVEAILRTQPPMAQGQT